MFHLRFQLNHLLVYKRVLGEPVLDLVLSSKVTQKRGGGKTIKMRRRRRENNKNEEAEEEEEEGK